MCASTVLVVTQILAPIIALIVLIAYVSWRISQVHKLVNSRLTEALKEINRLGGKGEDF